jgi:hypothetical protein
VSGRVEDAVRAAVGPGDRLPTPTGRAVFEVAEVDSERVVLLFGEKQTRTSISWSVLEGIPGYLRGRGGVLIGGVYDLGAIEGSLDAYLKRHIKRATAGWVAVVLERAGVIDIDRARPASVQLRDGW